MNLDYILKARSDLMRKEEKKSYFYASTRARAMISKLLTEEDYGKIAKMDMNEILRFLEEKEYKKEIDAIGIKAAKIPAFETILNENFANSVNRLLRFMPPNCPLWAYIMKYDIANIKAILRSKATKGKKEDIWRALVPVGSFNRDYLQNLINLDTKMAVIEALGGTPYYSTIKKYESKSLEELEDALERFYFAAVFKIASAHENFRKLIKMEIDVRNALTLLRLKRAKIHEISKFMVKGGNLSIKRIEELGRQDEFEIINSLKTDKFWKFAPANTKELDKIEVGLKKFLFVYGMALQRKYNSFETLLGYLFGKEREIANVRILARSKIVKNPEDALAIRSRLYAK